MVLYFKKPRRACGYSYQMIVDFDKKTIKTGYFLTVSHCVEVKAADFADILRTFERSGFQRVEG